MFNRTFVKLNVQGDQSLRRRRMTIMINESLIMKSEGVVFAVGPSQ